MKVFISLSCLLILSSAFNTEFEAFKTKFGKKYRNAPEEARRLKTFQQNLKIIAKHNALHKQGQVSFDLGINKFADLTAEEFASEYNIHRPLRKTSTGVYESLGDPVPDSIDWRDSGCVSSVKDQGQCGSSCVFSATESIEGQNCIATEVLATLSPQRIAECCSVFGIQACNGCLMDQIYECLIVLEGRTNDSSYRISQQNEVCGADELTAGAVVTSYVDVLSKSEDALKNATGLIGPISTAIDASHASFQLYSSGVYYEPACYENVLDHGVLVAGYGREGDLDYWLVKNSWGTSWGEQGYIKMSRNKDNNCGIATEASYPVLEA